METLEAKIKYAEKEGSQILFSVFGNGNKDLLISQGLLSNCDETLALPSNAKALKRLANHFRVIMFDRRGTGRSDPLPMGCTTTWEDWADDLKTVLDAAYSNSAIIHGERDGAVMAMAFAAAHPERTEYLSISNSTARYLKADDYPIGQPSENANRILEVVRKWWGTEDLQRFIDPHKDLSPETRRMHARFERGIATPRMAAEILSTMFDFDGRSMLSSIRVPTVVMHRSDAAMFPIAHAQYIAENIPNSHFIEIQGEGEVSPLFSDDLSDVFENWVELVTGSPATSESQTKLASLVFCDIANSTQYAAELGDLAWDQLLKRFQALVRGEIARFDGVEIDTAGDGFFITFDRPSHAVRCALRISESVHALDLQVRCGVHAGECAINGKNLSGMNVHVGARIESAAKVDEVWVSETVKSLTIGSGINFEKRGDFELKGVPDTWALYAAIA